MAIQFARVERISRSQGKNACCKSAYNARARINDLNTNVTYTFERISDNIHHELLLPSNIDIRFKDLATFSNEVERVEKRKNSQLYKEYVLALPDQEIITLEQKKEMVYEFISRSKFIEEGLGVQLDIHKPHNGNNNWHAHLLVTTRRFKEDGSGLGAKARDLEPTVRSGATRAFVAEKDITPGELWKEVQNEVFERYDLGIRVDDIAKVPGVHLGPVRMRGLMNEVTQFHEEHRKNAIRVLTNAEQLLDLVTEKKAVFSRYDLIKELNSLAAGKQQSIINEVVNSPRVLALYHQDGSSANLFTTTEVREEEERAIRIADRIAGVHKDCIGNISSQLNNLVKRESITSQQEAALRYLVDWQQGQANIKVLQGRAGSGKSYVLKQLKNLLEPYRKVIGLAPTHRAIAELNKQGFEAHTIKSFLFKCRNGSLDVPKDSVLVVDEAGMVGTSSYLELLKVAYSTKARLVLAGDDRQLASVERGGLFSVLAQRYGAATLDQVIRQQSEWGKEVSYAFSIGDLEQGIRVLKQQDRVEFDVSKEASMLRLLQNWSESKEDIENRLIIAISNKDVNILNRGAREILKSQGIITGLEFEIENHSYTEVFAQGDRIVISKSDKSLNVKNGEFGKITTIAKDEIQINLDNGKQILANPIDLNFKHGYAVTVFKSQGSSILDVYVAHDGFATKNNAYVEMSRHIKDLHLYCNIVATSDEQELVKQFSQVVDRGSSLNYLVDPDLKERGSLLFSVMGDLFKEGVRAIGDRLHKNHDYYVFEQQKLSPNRIKEVILESSETLQQVVGMDAIIYTGNYQENGVKIEKNYKNSTFTQANGSFSNKSSSKFMEWNDEVARIRGMIKFQAEQIARDLLGEPNGRLSTANTLRFGEHGKMVIEICGSKAGVWYDFSQGKGGDLLALIAREKKLEFKDSLEFAKYYVKAAATPDLVGEIKLRTIAEQINVKENTEKLEKLYKESVFIDPEQTLAKKYLEDKRGISIENIGEDIRFASNLWNGSLRQHMPAIVAFARDRDGIITGASATYLEAESGDKIAIGAKRSFGKVRGSYVELQQANLGITIIAEGVETALSLKQANVPGRILASLGIYNFKNYNPDPDELVVIAADHDKFNPSSRKALEVAKQSLQEQGAKVAVVLPSDPGDFNDVLRQSGVENVYAAIVAKLQPYLSRDWLEVWKNSDKLIMAKETILNNLDGSILKAQYQELFAARQQELAVFIASNQENLAKMVETDPSYNLDSLQSKLNSISKEKWDKELQTAIIQQQQQLAVEAERASTPYGLTKEEFIRGVEQQVKYLEDAVSSREFLKPDFGVEDFQGNKRVTREDYLSALGRDPTIQALIDYDSCLGKQIKEEVDNISEREARTLKLEELEKAKEQQLDVERLSTPYGVTKAEFKALVEKNIKYLEDGFSGKMEFLKVDFGVEDFQGNKYKVTEEYLSALGRDPKLQPLIDYQDDLGNKIQNSMEHQTLLEKNRESSREL